MTIGARSAIPGGVAISVEIIPHPFILAAQVMAFGVGFQDFTEPLKKAADDVMGPSFEKNFAVGGRPRWPALSALTILNRTESGFGAGPILVRTGALRGVAGDIGIWTIGRESAAVTNTGDVEYGVMHQTGTGSMPARPWAVLQDEDVNEIQDVFINWVRKRLLMTGFRPGVG
jgi:phage gpG-like protein